MPALMRADAAARRIAAGLERGGFEVTFPRRFTWPVKLLAKLPHGLYFRFINFATGWKKRPLRPR